MLPSTHFARSGDLHIGYQVLGDGPFDLLFVPGIISHLDLWWDDPRSARFFERLASFSRLILLDKRGLGVSDRVAGWATLEERMDDLRAVMDAAGSESAALVGVSEGGPLSLLFAAAHPERCSALCVVGGFARMVRGDDYPYGVTRQQMLNLFEEVVANWGKPGLMRLIAPTLWSRPEEHEGWGRFERAAASPGAIRSGIEMNSEIDVRHVLPQIRVPTLVVHRRQDRAIPFGMGEYLADHIPGARMVALEGKDHLFWLEGDEVVDAIQEFLTGEHAPAPVDRVLATVLFIDIVESTRRVAEQGDRAWVETLVRFKTIVQRQLERFRGHEVDDSGDGVLATFDGPARAIRCADSIRSALRTLDLEVRVGLHSGECERVGEKLGGIAVHIGARVAATAEPGELLVSSTVRDLVAGSGIEFQDRGMHELRGVPGEWRLLAVQAA